MLFMKTNRRKGQINISTFFNAFIVLVCVIIFIRTEFTIFIIFAFAYFVSSSRAIFCSDFLSFKSLLWTILGWFTIISIPWEFIRLYHHQLALQISQSISGLPEECLPSQTTSWSLITMWLKETFTWKNDDKCLQYHKAMLINPIWEVTPAKVLISLLTTCITQPLEGLANALGFSYKLFFQHIPVQWQPFIFIQLFVFLIVFAFVFNKYRFSFPLFTLEPKVSLPMLKHRQT
ncbi:hypothetical protein EB796_011912 [Bugula neritina]|uniref:Chloride channel CLIC-like protein 1 n=1 Tax=Bugula neritina TaxID=10212 RepID=A0A7J7JVS4_BUGNE|nr:hypothetical protein EB796_011912 [Bugula neritina]